MTALYASLLGQSNATNMKNLYGDNDSGSTILQEGLATATGLAVYSQFYDSSGNPITLGVGGSTMDGDFSSLPDERIWWYLDSGNPGGALVRAVDLLNSQYQDIQNDGHSDITIALSWSQGENDISQIANSADPATMAQRYEAATQQVFDYIEASLSVPMDFYIVQTEFTDVEGASTTMGSSSIQNYLNAAALVQQAQQNLASANANVHSAVQYDDLQSRYETGTNMSDKWHLGFESYEVVGARLAEFIADDLGYNGSLVNIPTINGDASNNYLTGDAADNYILAAAGDDYVMADDGDDIVMGGAGNDRLYGGADNDTLIGEAGNDKLYGGTGDDLLFGKEGNDKLYGHEGDDLLAGGDGRDRLYGGQNNDTLLGLNGNDILQGDSGNDSLHGGDGKDKLEGGDGDDTLTGGDMRDWLYGDAGQDVLYGGSGKDDMHGGAGNDTLYGDEEKDTLFGDAGNGTLVGGDARDILTGGTGADYFVFTATSDSVRTGSLYDAITDFEVGIDKIDLSALDFDGLSFAGSVEDSLRVHYSTATDRTYFRNDFGSDFEFYLESDYTNTISTADFLF